MKVVNLFFVVKGLEEEYTGARERKRVKKLTMTASEQSSIF